jgi:hypothetical protein
MTQFKHEEMAQKEKDSKAFMRSDVGGNMEINLERVDLNIEFSQYYF